jgi:hypothetical protein
VIEVAMMLTAQNPEAAIVVGCFVEIDQHGQNPIVGVGVVGKILMPLDWRADSCRFAVQLAVLEVQIGSDQRLDSIHNAGIVGD